MPNVMWFISRKKKKLFYFSFKKYFVDTKGNKNICSSYKFEFNINNKLKIYFRRLVCYEASTVLHCCMLL